MKFLTILNSKYITVTLHIVTKEKPELTFLLILYFHRGSKPSKRTKKQECAGTMSKQYKHPVLWFWYLRSKSSFFYQIYPLNKSKSPCTSEA